ncbi:MAG: LytTR family DNA-binding domain-containing protein, partial [bacterium]
RVLTTLERVRQRLDERALVDWARELSEGTSLTLSAGRAPAEKASATEGVLVVKSRGGTEYLPLSCIEVIESSGDIVRIATTECVVETSTPLFELERRLDPALFIRTHRAIIVNVRTARRLDTASRGCGLLLLHSGRTVSVSRRRIAAVRQALRHQVSSAP